MFNRCRPLLCVIATGTSFGAQQPTHGCSTLPNRLT